MTAPRRSRVAPSPNSILDRKAFERALDEAGISLKKTHLDGFYQSLHRQHYPSLQEFVSNYYKNETKQNLPDLSPLKNKVSSKKNRNKVQLPRVLLDFLDNPENGFVTVTTTVDQAKTSADGTTTKLAVRLHDGHLVESVLMRYITKDGSRASLCVSSQVGCAMGCTFCATGTMGIKGDLTTGEILEQIVHADRILAREALAAQKENRPKNKLDLVRNVVFMGMGEPLNNYDNVLEACRGLIDRKRWNLAHGRVTVSTVGVTPKIHNLTRDIPEISLALSLHAPNQEMRTKIVPAAKAYNIEGLIDALDRHMMAYLSKNYDGAKFTKAERIKESTRRRAMIEYVMLEGDTSTFECAHQLGKLCENRHLVVNLIPYNQTDVKDKLRCPSDAHMREFQRIVTSYGTFCTIRKTMGADIASACGQLVVNEGKNSNVDIEDGPFQKRTTTAKDVGNDVPTTTSKTRSIATMPTHERPSDTDDIEKWIKPLAIATSIAASCFVVSSILFLSQRRGGR